MRLSSFIATSLLLFLYSPVANAGLHNQDEHLAIYNEENSVDTENLQDIDAEITRTSDRLKAILATAPDMDKPAVEQLSQSQIKEAQILWEKLGQLQEQKETIEKKTEPR